jgi:hypothetical protein
MKRLNRDTVELIFMRRMIKALQDAGGGLLLCTDMQPEDGVIHQELEALVTAGLTPYQALAAGTKNIAAFYGPKYQGGTIATGNWADLVLLRGNPLQDIRHTARPAAVMVNGKIVYRRWLQEELFYDLRATFDSVVKDLVLTGKLVTPETELIPLRQSRTTYEASLKALADSLGPVADSTSLQDTKRVRDLLGKQLDAYRVALASTPARQEIFDSAARIWMKKRAVEGNAVEISTVQGGE